MKAVVGQVEENGIEKKEREMQAFTESRGRKIGEMKCSHQHLRRPRPCTAFPTAWVKRQNTCCQLGGLIVRLGKFLDSHRTALLALGPLQAAGWAPIDTVWLEADRHGCCGWLLG